MPFYPHCPDCGAELQESPLGLRCPWVKPTDEHAILGTVGAPLTCGKPKKRVTFTFDTSKDRFK